MSVRECPVCGGEGRPDFIGGEYRMFRCVGCRTAYVDPVPTDETLERFYATFHQSRDQGGWYDDVESRMQADFPAKLHLVQTATGGKPGRLLDIGCGKGHFVKACVDASIDAQGIDLSESGIEHARKTTGIKATCGRFEDAREELGPFDTITLWATIEHLPDPRGMLEAIFEGLNPGGHVFVDTGIGDDWLDRLIPGRVQWYDPPQHLFVFSADGLSKLLEVAGFDVVGLDRNFERSSSRRLIKNLRNGVTAAALRCATSLGRVRAAEFDFTRYPVGNLMSIVGRKGT